MRSFLFRVSYVFLIITMVFISAEAFTQDSCPSSIRYKISKINKILIMDGKFTTIEKNASDDVIYSVLEYQISGLDTGNPVLEKFIHGKKHPKGTRQLVRLKTSHNGNIFLGQDEPDIPYNDGFFVLITIFPAQRLIIHSFQNESIESCICASQIVCEY